MIIALILIALVLSYMAIHYKDQYGIIQILFVSFALGLLMLAIAFIKDFAYASGISGSTLAKVDTGYTVVMWGFVIFLVYFFIMFLINILVQFEKIGRKKI